MIMTATEIREKNKAYFKALDKMLIEGREEFIREVTEKIKKIMERIDKEEEK